MRDAEATAHIKGLSTDWLSQCLAAGGYNNVAIDSFETEPIGIGQLAHTFRVWLQQGKDSSNIPRSLVYKRESDDPLSQATGSSGLYQNEVGFYQDLSHKLSIRTPKCYHAEINDTGSEFGLLLEDLSPATPGDQLGGCSVSVARSGVIELAGLHAPTWAKQGLEKLGWIDLSDEKNRMQFMHDLYCKNLPGFLNRYGADLEDWMADIFEQFAAASNYADRLHRSGAACLTHGDYRLDNLMLSENRSAVSLYAIDWQTVAISNPLSDVALFIGGGLLPDLRSAHEEHIVRDYHQRLLSLGVAGYDWLNCWTDYRLATFCGLMTAVSASMMTVRTERGDELFSAMAHRHACHVKDLNGLELLN